MFHDGFQGLMPGLASFLLLPTLLSICIPTGHSLPLPTPALSSLRFAQWRALTVGSIFPLCSENGPLPLESRPATLGCVSSWIRRFLSGSKAQAALSGLWRTTLTQMSGHSSSSSLKVISIAVPSLNIPMLNVNLYWETNALPKPQGNVVIFILFSVVTKGWIYRWCLVHRRESNHSIPISFVYHVLSWTTVNKIPFPSFRSRESFIWCGSFAVLMCLQCKVIAGSIEICTWRNLSFMRLGVKTSQERNQDTVVV